MHFAKLRVSAEATSRLRSLRQRTGITPNLLCRIALMMSLEEGSVSTLPTPDESGQEFNAYTLTGQHHAAFIALVRFVEEGGLSTQLADEVVLSRLRGHLHRGIGYLAMRAKSPLELARLSVPA